MSGSSPAVVDGVFGRYARTGGGEGGVGGKRMGGGDGRCGTKNGACSWGADTGGAGGREGVEEGGVVPLL